jgi:hypothetical protein
MMGKLTVVSEVLVHRPKIKFDKYKTKKAQLALIGKQMDTANDFVWQDNEVCC